MDQNWPFEDQIDSKVEYRNRVDLLFFIYFYYIPVNAFLTKKDTAKLNEDRKSIRDLWLGPLFFFFFEQDQSFVHSFFWDIKHTSKNINIFYHLQHFPCHAFLFLKACLHQVSSLFSFGPLDSYHFHYY